MFSRQARIERRKVDEMLGESSPLCRQTRVLIEKNMKRYNIDPDQIVCRVEPEQVKKDFLGYSAHYEARSRTR